ncbi:MAG: hypothetical protein CMJ58_28750 [Planctomycetaceae bacterium]|nr:hypothetical protein [Planctomycetaceae bacterium]
MSYTTCRLPQIAAGALGSALLCAYLGGNLAHGEGSSVASVRSSEESRESDEPADAARRMREGSRIQNAIGYFRRNGDGATFITEDGMELGGLPNLNLERVVKMLKTVDEPESVYWSINGEVTEFTGRNYVLISRAVFKTAAPPPAPEVLGE